MSETCLVIVEDRSERIAELEATLEWLGFGVLRETMDPARVTDVARLRRPAFVVVEASPGAEVLALVLAVSRERLAPLVVMSRSTEPGWDRKVAEAGAMAHLTTTCPREAVGSTLEVVRLRWQELRAIEREHEKLGKRMRDRIIIEQAKGILMEKHPGMTEKQAYERMRTLSMRTRKSLAEVAAAIILAYQAEGDDPEDVDSEAV